MRRLALITALLVASSAHADPAIGRVLTTPTAWMPAQGSLVGTAGVDRRGDGSLVMAYGLGLASVEIGTDTDVRGCTTCDGDLKGDALWLGRAGFKLGARQDQWFQGQPALVLGVRNTFAAHGHDFGGARVTDGYVVASERLGPVSVHVGADLVDGGFRGISLGPTLRPMAGLEWTPAPYPKTTVLADVMWVPKLEPDKVELEWLAGWGVRYQALRWGSIELAVRHRQDEGLQESTVLVRLNGVWNGQAESRR